MDGKQKVFQGGGIIGLEALKCDICGRYMQDKYKWLIMLRELSVAKGGSRGCVARLGSALNAELWSSSLLQAMACQLEVTLGL